MNVQGFHPAMSAPMQSQAVSQPKATGIAQPMAASNSQAASNDPTSASALQSTFLNLLVTELQNQDPTQPVDPTQMVSQMVSLNQLDQLISINQSLATLTGEAAAAGSNNQGGSGSQGGSGNPGTGTSNMSSPAAPSHTLAAGSATPNAQSPFTAGAVTPAAWMNLYGNIGAPANYSNHFTAQGGR